MKNLFKVLLCLTTLASCNFGYAQCKQGNQVINAFRFVDSAGTHLMSVTETAAAGDTSFGQRQIIVSSATTSAMYSYTGNSYTFYLPTGTWQVSNQKTCANGSFSGWSPNGTFVVTDANVPDVTKFHATFKKVPYQPGYEDTNGIVFTYDDPLAPKRDILIKVTRRRGTLVDAVTKFIMKNSGDLLNYMTNGDFTFECCFEQLPLKQTSAWIVMPITVTIP